MRASLAALTRPACSAQGAVSPRKAAALPRWLRRWPPRRAAALPRRTLLVALLLARGALPFRSPVIAPRRASFAAPAAFAPFPRLAFGPRLNHRQRHTVTFLVHGQHPDAYDVVDRHDVVGAL